MQSVSINLQQATITVSPTFLEGAKHFYMIYFLELYIIYSERKKLVIQVNMLLEPTKQIMCLNKIKVFLSRYFF